VNPRPYLVISGVLFGAIAVLHLTRLVSQVEVQVGTRLVPMRVSWVGLVVASALALWALRLAWRRR
jgi:ABC-type lipoprotein release transport system permease subunit